MSTRIPGKSGGLKGSTQHSAWTHAALKTKEALADSMALHRPVELASITRQIKLNFIVRSRRYLDCYYLPSVEFASLDSLGSSGQTNWLLMVMEWIRLTNSLLVALLDPKLSINVRAEDFHYDFGFAERAKTELVIKTVSIASR